MIPILYDTSETQFTSNGICRLPDCISCQVTEERNSIYELLLEYPVTGKNFDKIQLGRVAAVTHDDSGDIQPFDLVAMSKPIDGKVKFKGVHISYRLNGCSAQVAKGTDANGMAALVSVAARPFTFYSDTVFDGTIPEFDGLPHTIKNYLGGTDGSLLDTFGGEYEFDKFNVKFYRQRGEKKNFDIRYGLNLVDYNEDLDYSETYNKCVPYWAGESTSVVGSVVDSGVPAYNGIDKYIPLDLSDRFDSAPTTTQLKKAARSYMATNKPYLPKHSIEVDFIRLQDSPDYKQFASLMTCRLCDIITVIFPMYNISADFKIVRVTWDVLKGRYESIELGELATTLAQALGI